MLWTTSGEGSCLRDYRVAPTKEIRNFSRASIEAMIETPGHFWEMASHRTYKDTAFWRDQISFKNTESGLATIDLVNEGTTPQKLLSLFINQVSPLLTDERCDELPALVARWIDGFKAVVEREQFNHFDNSIAPTFDFDHGFGWSAAMLESCRSTDGPLFIDTGRDDLDYKLLAVEVCLGLSSKDNPFQLGKRNSIQPDGLGIRRDNSLLVLEMKGPQDDHDLLTATLQAFCGALAIMAKYQWVTRLMQSTGSRRPAVLTPIPPLDPCPVSLYIMVVPKMGESIATDGDTRLQTAVRHLRTAVPLGDVAYFILDRHRVVDVASTPVAFAY